MSSFTTKITRLARYAVAFAFVLIAITAVIALIRLSGSHATRPQPHAPSKASAGFAKAAADRVYDTYMQKARAFKVRRDNGEDLYQENMELLEKTITEIEALGDVTAARRLKIIKAVEVSVNEWISAVRVYVASAGFQGQKPFVKEVFDSPERVELLRKQIDQWELANQQLHDQMNSQATRLTESLRALGLTDTEIAEWRLEKYMPDESEEKIRWERDRTLIAAFRGAIDVVVEAGDQCTFGPGYTIEIDNFVLNFRLYGHLAVIRKVGRDMGVVPGPNEKKRAN